MNIILITQNLQGANSPSKVDVLRNYYWSTKASVDILCFQEHRLRGDRLLAFGRTMWPRADFFCKEASLGYGHNLGEAGASKGGVCMWASPAIKHQVLSSGFSRCGRAQWIRLGGFPGGDVSVLNVYASTDSRERTELWTELLASLAKDCKWIMSGDWNLVERREDKSSTCGKLISPAERRAFENLTGSLNLEDRFPNTGRTKSSTKYTWDNRRRDGVRILARLDRIYSFQPTGTQTNPMAEYYIKSDSNHSDHLPVWGKFILQAAPPRTSSYKMNARYFDDIEVKVKFHQIW